MPGSRSLARSPLTPPFGRDRELAEILAAIGVTAPRPPAAVLLSGDAGIGKTRLLEEVMDTADRAGRLVLVGHCLDLGDNAMPYQPFVEALGLLDIARGDALAVRFGALAPLLPSWGGEADAGQRVSVDRTELFATVMAGLDLLADEQPLLLIVEDAHWADGSTRQLLRFLLECRFAHPVHLIVS